MTIDTKGQTYPHTAFIEQLAKEADTRVLTEEEAMAVTEATMFEALVSDTIPELRMTINGFRCIPGCCECGPKCKCAEHPHLAETNAKVFLKVALSFALGMSNDVTRVMERKQLPALRTKKQAMRAFVALLKREPDAWDYIDRREG